SESPNPRLCVAHYPVSRKPSRYAHRQVIRNQMLRCGPSVGANYRSACRAKSKPDFVSKMGTVEEETDETIYWMELLIDAEICEATTDS
ncbi:MAG: four helix bundle protein, partial [Pyrinomonadaceae bacterium]